jgi:hypothetical protein
MRGLQALRDPLHRMSDRLGPVRRDEMPTEDGHRPPLAISVDMRTTSFMELSATMANDKTFVPPLGPFTYTRQFNPDRTEVSDAAGWVATYTDGAKTVIHRGQTRTFTEQLALFTDPFSRTVTKGWGPSPSGGMWINGGGASSDYQVNGTTGIINVTTENVSRRVTVHNDGIQGPDITAKFSTDKLYAGGPQHCGIMTGYQDSDNYYVSRLSFDIGNALTVRLQKNVAGTLTTIAGPVTLSGLRTSPSDVWHIRTHLTTGGMLRARYWQSGTPEPSAWDLAVSDSTFAAGRVGVRVSGGLGITNLPVQFSVDDFTLLAGTWDAAHTPVVTHNIWVRVLDAPYNGGMINEPQLKAWLQKPTRDVLSLGMEYLANAPLVHSGSLDLAGPCDYGPLQPDGTRMEGADFCDYLGIPYVYASGETDQPEPSQFKCLDCSGYVRMIYGYRLGIPMVYTQDFNGLNLPRHSGDQNLSGPGIRYAVGMDAPPPLTHIQPGDLVCFDADTTNPHEEEGQIDHIGIYLGLDAHGKHRFVSSRKIGNGPTMGDVGGASILDGTGLYARSLRSLRRL